MTRKRGTAARAALEFVMCRADNAWSAAAKAKEMRTHARACSVQLANKDFEGNAHSLNAHLRLTADVPPESERALS